MVWEKTTKGLKWSSVGGMTSCLTSWDSTAFPPSLHLCLKTVYAFPLIYKRHPPCFFNNAITRSSRLWLSSSCCSTRWRFCWEPTMSLCISEYVTLPFWRCRLWSRNARQKIFKYLTDKKNVWWWLPPINMKNNRGVYRENFYFYFWFYFQWKPFPSGTTLCGPDMMCKALWRRCQMTKSELWYSLSKTGVMLDSESTWTDSQWSNSNCIKQAYLKFRWSFFIVLILYS
jgi:hypothetical protein